MMMTINQLDHKPPALCASLTATRAPLSVRNLVAALRHLRVVFNPVYSDMAKTKASDVTKGKPITFGRNK